MAKVAENHERVVREALERRELALALWARARSKPDSEWIRAAQNARAQAHAAQNGGVQ